MSRKTWKEVRAKGVTDEARVAEIRREAAREVLAHSLAELRAARELTQVELAAALETTQSVVSRTEHQDDLLLSTLRRFVSAMEGKLEIAAIFDDQRIVLEPPVGRISVLQGLAAKSSAEPPRRVAEVVSMRRGEGSHGVTARGASRSREGKRQIAVEPRPHGKWAVQKDGSKRASSVHDTKAPAVKRARSQAKREGAELVIKDRQGRIGPKDSNGHDPRQPH